MQIELNTLQKPPTFLFAEWSSFKYAYLVFTPQWMWRYIKIVALGFQVFLQDRTAISNNFDLAQGRKTRIVLCPLFLFIFNITIIVQVFDFLYSDIWNNN